MNDEDTIRLLVRNEIERYIPLLRLADVRLTIPECSRRYRRRTNFILALIRRGELEAVYLPKGKNGKPQYLVVTASAEKHPMLGGQA